MAQFFTEAVLTSLMTLKLFTPFILVKLFIYETNPYKSMKANKIHNFSSLFDKVLYMCRTGPLSIISSISTLYTRNRYLSC